MKIMFIVMSNICFAISLYLNGANNSEDMQNKKATFDTESNKSN